MSGREDGSALVEVLVAFVILSITVIAGFRIFTDGLARIGSATAALELARNAEALLTAAGQGEASELSMNGQRFVVSRTPLGVAAEPWVEVKPVRLRIWEEGHEDTPPLIDTVVIAPVPKR